MEDYIHSRCYRDLLLNSDHPIVLPGLANDWTQVSWELENWAEVFDDVFLPVHIESTTCSSVPNIQNSSSIDSLRFANMIDMLSIPEEHRPSWFYFEYKNLFQWFPESLQYFDPKCWSKIGFPERSPTDTYIWFGSTGANSPCHFDCYGYNIVTQVYGTKRWFLFPPSEIERMKPTRIPYEESTVFSSINFACKANLKNIEFENCYCVDLNPGDVLYVPPKWWHFVINITTAISLNTWIPHADDDEWRLKESIVRYFVFNTFQFVDEQFELSALCPSEREMSGHSLSLQLIQHCTKNCSRCKSDYDSKQSLVDLNVYNGVEHNHNKYVFLKPVTNEILRNMINCKCKGNTVQEPLTAPSWFGIPFINAACDDKVINLIKDNLLKNDRAFKFNL